LIGVDIVYLPRFQRIIEGYNGERLLRRIFSEEELRQCEGKGPEARIQSLAGRYAVKEAVIKASKGEIDISSLAAIEIRQDASGAFEVWISIEGVLCRHYEASLSHDGEYAVAVAIMA
jgi:holo-[acyl-carrier protein] synthase